MSLILQIKKIRKKCFLTKIGFVTMCAIEVSESLELKRVWRKKKSRKRGGQYPKFFEDVWEAVGKVISLESSWREKENHFTVDMLPIFLLHIRIPINMNILQAFYMKAELLNLIFRKLNFQISTFGQLNFWTTVFWTTELLDNWTLERLNFGTTELSNNWTFGQLNFWTTEL